MSVGTSDDKDDDFDNGNKENEDSRPNKHGVLATVASAAAVTAAAAATVATAIVVGYGDKSGEKGSNDDGTEPDAETNADVCTGVDASLPVARAANDKFSETP